MYESMHIYSHSVYPIAPDGTYPNGIRDVFKQLVSFGKRKGNRNVFFVSNIFEKILSKTFCIF